MLREISARSRRKHRFSLGWAAAFMAMWLVGGPSCFGQEGPNSDTDRNFSLQEGHGVPVCEAYLELLNKTKFEVTPFCGRPHEGLVKGFEHLDGHAMRQEEIWPLFTKVWEFMHFGDQNHKERFYYPNNVSPQLAYWSSDATSRDTIDLDLSNGWMYVWAFSPSIDINNDGAPLSIITWQGYGATEAAVRCGSDYASRSWDISYINQAAFVLSADGKSIDENKTRLIFGVSPDAKEPAVQQAPAGNSKSAAKAFKPLADSIGVFKYEGRYYIETEGRPAFKDDDLPPVHVLLREHGSARRVCTLKPVSVPMPMD